MILSFLNMLSQLKRMFPSQRICQIQDNQSKYKFDFIKYKISLMIQEISQYFNHFYQAVLKQHINDPIVHSQWMYFLSMFKSSVLDKERIDLYLGILSNEKGKKIGHKNKDSILSIYNNTQTIKSRPESKIKLISSGENQITSSDIKLQKRFSENWRPRTTVPSFQGFNEAKMLPETITLKKKVSVQDESNRLIRGPEVESKSYRNINEHLYALPSSCAPNHYAYLKSKSINDTSIEVRCTKNKQKHKKLCEISKRLVNVFDGSKLRA